MTREEVLAMESGPDMDDHVAEYVMGYLIDRFIFRHNGMEEPCRVWIDAGGKTHNPRKLSTDISAAWKVFDKFEMPELKKWFDPEYDEWYKCSIGNNHISERQAPLAICRCALLSVMEGKDAK
ncbi:BC1872 family protein [Paenibacillus alba]|uniref:Phage ABA sandwich domain-containing protein n=1 Tax=Paenibacillus alba TaxID=1197127 RepID=A0ABU6GEN9_9BACL|nr:hypothetical protein [Paenibacillus alba]MEC0232672.1 hypothetical protein [Paenibacillus alba]